MFFMSLWRLRFGFASLSWWRLRFGFTSLSWWRLRFGRTLLSQYFVMPVVKDIHFGKHCPWMGLLLCKIKKGDKQRSF
jgi:hypothetical protein